ncbi:urease accessory protein UreF [Tundrisphaera sp. TA3]|uniref:urease accessory protein UreF n=1 Tax=Tundrisphaera sp. TA3 TaxID=3435775 RepID=UPI003EBFF2DC
MMRLLQFGDSMLPVGAFSFSNGLESAIQRGVVRDTATLRDFIATAARQSATSDGVALLHAFRAARDGDLARIVGADRAAFNRRLNEEARTMSTRMGRKLAELAGAVLGESAAGDWLAAIKRAETPGTYPVGQGIVFSALGLGEAVAFAAHQYGVASMMVGAALRLMKLHYLDAQKILLEVNAEAPAAYDEVAARSLDEMASFAPAFDILAAVHVRATVRMFMN